MRPPRKWRDDLLLKGHNSDPAAENFREQAHVNTLLIFQCMNTCSERFCNSNKSFSS